MVKQSWSGPSLTANHFEKVSQGSQLQWNLLQILSLLHPDRSLLQFLPCKHTSSDGRVTDVNMMAIL